jgi:uncharacterized lipoprotein YbaY
MRLAIRSALACALVLALSGCVSKPGGHIKGQVVTGPDAYPTDSTLVVRFADATKRPARLVAEDRQALVPGWEAPGTHPPLAFDVAYSPQALARGHVYVVWAAVYEGDQLTAASTVQTVTVIGGGSNRVSLGLAPAASLATSVPLP